MIKIYVFVLFGCDVYSFQEEFEICSILFKLELPFFIYIVNKAQNSLLTNISK